MTALVRIGIAVALVACIAACATPSRTAPSAVVTSPRTKLITPDRMKDALVVGKSTKADVTAALGETLVISFEAGYEVWVYRLANDARGKEALPERIPRKRSEKAARAASAEFVILFAPSGVVAKTRIRPPPDRSQAG